LDFKTAGESHGKGLIGIISDYPAGISVDINFINNQLSRRQKGYGRGGRMAIEKDTAEIISGVRKGKSTGSPISFMIKNNDWINWKNIMSTVKKSDFTNGEKMLLDIRPGHSDLPGLLKYRLGTIRDVIERSSARETAARVCIGAFAKIVLNSIGITITSYVDRIGKLVLENIPDIKNKKVLAKIETSEVRCPDAKISEKIIEIIANTIDNGDSIGGSFKVIAQGIPPGLGSYVDWDKRFDARLSYVVMSIPAIKAVEIGNGISSGSRTGLDFHDAIFYKKEKGFYRKTNNAGGIEGGMTNGEDIIIGATMKPIPTTISGIKTVNIKTKKESTSLKERSDICAVPSASIVGEAVIAIELVRAIQDKFGRDTIEEIKENLDNYNSYLKKV